MRDEAPALPSVRVCLLSHEFVMRMRERVGAEPTVDMVNRLLAESKRIRRQQTLYKLINGEYVPYQCLGEHWHDGIGIIMVVNEYQSVAVTVFTPREVLSPRARPPRHVRCPNGSIH